MSENVICPACGAPMILRQTSKFKHKDGSNKKFYGCSRFPACKEIHGAHPDGKPLGIPALKEVKDLRIRVHALFDPLWQGGQMTRQDAYVMMSERMGAEFHVANLDKGGCEKALAILKEVLQ